VDETIEFQDDDPGLSSRLSVAARAALLDDTVDMIVVLDASGHLVYANRPASAVLGWTPGDAEVTVTTFIHPDDRSHMEVSLARFVAGTSPRRLKRLRVRHHEQDRWLWVEVLASNRVDVAGLDGVIITARDVTEQVDAERQLAESEERFRSLVTASSDSVLMISSDGEVIYASPRAETLLAAAGSSIDDLASAVHPDDLEGIRRAFAAARESDVGSQYEATLRVPAGDGRWRWKEAWVVNQLGVRGVDALVVYARDVTSRLEAEVRLRSRVEADEMVARIAARFVEVGADEVEGAVEVALAELGGFCQADRAWIFRLHPEHGRIDYTHEWCAPGIPPAIDELHDLAVEDMPGFASWVGQAGPLLVRSVASMGPGVEQERAILESQGIRSLAAQAMFVKGEPYGIIGLDTVTREVVWPEQVVWALEACANIFGSALRRCEAETELAMNEARFRAMFDQAADGVRVLDSDLRTVYASPAVLRITGCSERDLVDPGMRLLMVHPEDRDFIEECRAELLARPGQAVTGDYRMLRPDGSWVHIEEVSTNLLHDPAVRGVVVNVRDVTERHAYEAELLAQARRDQLTGLPNRLLFEELVESALARGSITGSSLAVISFDLDRFKLVNESLGHDVGDAVLVEAADRLRAVVRGGDVVARLGADEFAILSEPITIDELEQLAESIIGQFREPFSIGEQRVYSTATMGVAFSDDVSVAASMLRAADAARAAAKQAGGNRAAVFAGEMGGSATERIDLEAGLRRAIDAGELALHYQPIIDLENGAVVAAEALLRWEHPSRGLLAPNAFLDVAEQTGLIAPIGTWVISEAGRQLAAWHRSHPAISLTMHVNVSVRQLAEGGVAATIRQMLDELSLPPGSLCIEITESTLLAGNAPLSELAAVQESGVMVALDDFGTGHSSLAYLRHLDIDTLKIDRQFVDGLTEGGSDAAIVAAIVSLADSLGFLTVGEGVETPEQLDALRELGCVQAQGFYFSRPISAEQFGQYLDGQVDS
jgi:diguanylate cyclase (GGDEF)-like protein/PAS domain S-box-containing protein